MTATFDEPVGSARSAATPGPATCNKTAETTRNDWDSDVCQVFVMNSDSSATPEQSRRLDHPDPRIDAGGLNRASDMVLANVTQSKSALHEAWNPVERVVVRQNPHCGQALQIVDVAQDALILVAVDRWNLCKSARARAAYGPARTGVDGQPIERLVPSRLPAIKESFVLGRRSKRREAAQATWC